MTSDEPKNDALSIRCPSCAARFTVSEELRGQVVDCGECGHSFEVQDPVMPRGRKHYPGENRDPLLDQLPKVNKPLPRADDKNAPDDFASQSVPVYVEPISPQRLLLGTLALFAALVTALLLILGAKTGGALDGVSMENRMLMAAFVAILATALLIYSNRRSWLLMLLTGLLVGSGLVSLPLFFTGGSKRLGDEVRRSPNSSRATTSEEDKKLTPEQLRELIGVEPLLKERARLLESGSTQTALGLWLRELEVSNSLLIKDYVIRVMDASPETHYYPRGKGDFLMVVTGVDGDLQQLADAAAAFGGVAAIHPSLHVVEVNVNNSRFESGPMDVLTDPNHQRYYELNLIELQSIDLDRVSAAVRRISEAKPVLLRNDISKRLVELLESTWFENKGDVSRALLVWAMDDGRAGEAALEQAVILHEADKQVPPEMIALCIQQGEMDVLPLLYELWQSNPSRWEPWFREAGEASENTILLGFDQTRGVLRQSACRILGQIGTAKSLPVLKLAAAETRDVETKIIANSSIQLIEKREQKR